jgi:glycerol-3-phosphate dehydrogenase
MVDASGAAARSPAATFNGTWSLTTERGPHQYRLVINAAGNHGDIVEAICRPSPFKVTPRKGQFVVFDKPAANLVKSIILPVPTARTKGIVICKTAFGNLLVGPTAEDQEEPRRRRSRPTDAGHADREGQRDAARPRRVGVNAVYAGLRPATPVQGLSDRGPAGARWITVGGIRSTGLTASLGIAAYVADLMAQHFHPMEEAAPIWTPVPNLCEERPAPLSDRRRDRLSLRMGDPRRDRGRPLRSPCPPAISAA